MNKKNEKKYIGLREVVSVTLFSVLTFMISALTAMPFAASVHLQLYAGYALFAIISGPVYVLMISKSPKTGTQILFLAIKGIYMLLMGQVLTGGIFILGGFICELIVVKGGYHKPIQAGAAYMLHNTLYGLGSFFPMLVFADTYAQKLISNGYNEVVVEKMVSLYQSPIVIITVILTLCISSAIGMWCGLKMMKKHFRPAGVV